MTKKFINIYNFVASADRPIVTYKKGNLRQLKDDPRVSLSTGTSQPNRHTHDLTVEDGDILITIIVQRFSASFAFA